MWELVSYASLKSLLGLAGVTIADYPSLSLIKTGVESAIENYLGRDLESKARTETFYITGPTNLIHLRALPVSTVASLVVTMFDEPETYESDNDDYDIVRSGLRVYSNLEDAKVAITYTGGFSSVPTDISRAALLQTAYEFLSKDQIGATFTSTEGGSVTRPELGLLKEVKRLLTRYIHPLKIA